VASAAVLIAVRRVIPDRIELLSLNASSVPLLLLFDDAKPYTNMSRRG
jgi:hypothetical protein